MKRFEKKEDCYLDTKTGLEWSLDNLGRSNYKNAINICKNLGHDWRLPTIKELLFLVDFSKYDPCTELPNMKSAYYWSSTTYAYRSGGAWRIYFGYGDVDGYGESGTYFVRAVRSGQQTLFYEIQTLCEKYEDKRAIVVEMLDCEGMENAIIDELRERGKRVKEI